jgi:hypothetical protein
MSNIMSPLDNFLSFLRGRAGCSITAGDAALLVYGADTATKRRAIGHLAEELTNKGELVCSSYGSQAGYYIPISSGDQRIAADLDSLIRRAKKTLVQVYKKKRLVNMMAGGNGQLNWIAESDAVYSDVKRDMAAVAAGDVIT